MRYVSIGKGLCRIIVRSKAKRERLSRISEVIVDGGRVIFPERLLRSIEMIVEPPLKKKSQKQVQTELFQTAEPDNT